MIWSFRQAARAVELNDVGTKPVPQGCSEKRRLISELTAAHRWIASIHNQEMEAVMRGDSSTDEWLQAQLKRAHELKVSFMQELKKHVAKHSC